MLSVQVILVILNGNKFGQILIKQLFKSVKMLKHGLANKVIGNAQLQCGQLEQYIYHQSQIHNQDLLLHKFNLVQFHLHIHFKLLLEKMILFHV